MYSPFVQQGFDDAILVVNSAAHFRIGQLTGVPQVLQRAGGDHCRLPQFSATKVRVTNELSC